MLPLVSLHGEQARQSTFPPGSRVYISADPQHSISPKTTILAPGEVVGVMLQMGKPGQLDLFYKVEVKGLDKDEKRTELITESRLRFRNGSPVTVDLKHGDEKLCVDGIVLGYCDIPPTDDRRKYSGNAEFWYSVQLLDNPNINVIRIMHEVSNSQLSYRPPATPTLHKSAEKGKTRVKEETDLDIIIPTQNAMELESSRDTECSTSGGGAESIATTSQSLNEINNAAAKVKVEFDASRDVQTGALHCDVTTHTDFAQDITSHQAHEPVNDPTKRKTSRESYQLLNEIHETDLGEPSKRLKSFPKETKKVPVQRKMTLEELEHPEQVELDPNEVLGICDLENTRRQQFAAREESSQEKVTDQRPAEEAADLVQEKIFDLGDIMKHTKVWESLEDPGSIPKKTKKTPAPRTNSLLKKLLAPTGISAAKEKEPPLKTPPSLKIKIPRKRKEWTAIPPAPHESHTKAHNGGVYFWCANCREGKGLWTGHDTMDHIEEGTLVHKSTVTAAGHLLNLTSKTIVKKSPTRLASVNDYSGSPSNCSRVGSESSFSKQAHKNAPFRAIMELPINECTVAAAIIGKGGCLHQEFRKIINCSYSVSSNLSKGKVEICGDEPDRVENGAYYLRDQISRFIELHDRSHDSSFINDHTTIDFIGDIEAYNNETGMGISSRKHERRKIAENEIASNTSIAHENSHHRAAHLHETNHSAAPNHARQWPSHAPHNRTNPRTDLRIILPTTIEKDVYARVIVGHGGRTNKRLKSETNATKIWFHCYEGSPCIDVKAKHTTDAERVAHHVLDYIQRELNTPLPDAQIVYHGF